MKKHIQLVLGLALGAGLVWWLFRDMDWRNVAQAFRNADLVWILAATATMLLTFVTRVQRWSYIVRTAKPVPFRALFSATQIGFLGTFILPMRAGELIRAYVLARLAKLPFSQCFAFVALDRVTDIAGLIAVMTVSLVAFRPKADIVLPEKLLKEPIPANFVQTGTIGAGIFLLLVVGTLVLLYMNRGPVLRLSKGATDVGARLVAACLRPFSHGLAERGGKAFQALGLRLVAMLDSFADGLHVFRSAPDMAKSLSYSLLTWFLALVFLECVMNAFGVERPWYTSCLMQTAIAVAVAIPGAPGFIGLYHLAVMIALTAVGKQPDYEVAAAVALMAHLLNLLPVVLVGLICLKVENLGLLSLRRASEGAIEESSEDTVQVAKE